MCENSKDQEKVYVDFDHIMTKGMTIGGIPGKNTRLGSWVNFQNAYAWLKLIKLGIKLENYFCV